MQINGVSAGLVSATSAVQPVKPVAAIGATQSHQPQAPPPPPAALPQAASSTSSAASLVNMIYSTNVGGKSYSGNIKQSGGTYQITVPNLPGATASGSTLQSAENALNIKIDTLV
jgi:hypothetical protein